MSPIEPAIIVHGGAATFATEHHDAARSGCAAAAQAGLDVLADGGSAVAAVVAAVRVLEDDPVFNAGTGAVLTRAGTVEMDASIMDGRDLRFGAVAAMPNIDRAIAVARMVMDDGEHVLLSGDGAWQFAREQGVTPSDPETLITARARNHLDAARQRRRSSGGADAPSERGGGTVGACAIDSHGHVAAGTSTGGTTYKRIGRIGDTPLCGAGTCADDRAGAASATGHGESIIRVTTTRDCVERMRTGAHADHAARAAITNLADAVGGDGGVICCDRSGRLGAAHNTEHMPHGVAVLRAGSARVWSGIRVEPGSDLAALLAGVSP
ncbi:MAG: isoaspartyl peptidase/L-asparaginase [Myxococcota bacterium]